MTSDGPHVTRGTHVGLVLVSALMVGLVVRFVTWLSVWLVHPQLISLEFVAVFVVAWKNVLVHFWWSRLLNVLQHTLAMKHWF
jgi:hypothetical protein